MATHAQVPSLDAAMRAVAQDLQSVKALGKSEFQVPHVKWGMSGSSYLLVPTEDPVAGQALFLHAYPQGDRIAGTLRLKNYERIREELGWDYEPPQGSDTEYQSEDPFLVMHAKVPDENQLQHLVTNTARLFFDGVYVESLKLTTDGMSTAGLYIPNSRGGHFTESINKWRANGIEIEKMTLDRTGMIRKYGG